MFRNNILVTKGIVKNTTMNPTTGKNYFRGFVFSAMLLFSGSMFGQEICNNGIDDDADGLIDLNDNTECVCTPATSTAPSLINNPSFETMNCCPSTYSELNCATGWIQASDATSDYFNTCGYQFPSATAAGIGPPDGAGYIGAIVSDGYLEYVGSCLSSPMIAGTSYSIQMQMASYPIDGFGGACGPITYPPLDLTMFGATSCASLPYSGYGCPPAPWMVLGSVTYTPSPTWGTVTITFTPSVNINAIILGASCAPLPPGYTYTTCYPYFYFDNMLVNTTASFTTALNQTGTWCSNNVQITGTNVAGATYQWYLNGVAIVGQTGLTINVSALGLPAGDYSLVTTQGGTCSVASSTVVATGSTTPVITPAGPFCANAASVVLVADIAGGTWSGTGITNPATGAFDPAAATVGNNTITYTTGGGCPGVGNTTIVVNALPTSNAGTDVNVCSGTPATIGTAPTGGYTYSWLPAAGLSATNISNPGITTVNGGAAPIITTYTVTTTSAGCTSTDAVVVTVDAPATANAGPAQTICNGNTATLAGTVGGSAISATWGGGGGSYSPSNNDLNAVYTPSAAEAASGSVTLTLVSNDPAGPCPVATSTVTITINPLATISAGPDQTICIGGTASLAGVIGGAATAGTWTGGSGTYSTTNTDPLAVYTPSAAEELAGSVTLTFTSNDPAGPCGSVNDATTISISALPSSNAGLDQTICSGTSATLSGTIGGAATMATWSGGGGVFTPNNTTLNAVYTPSAAEATAGTVMLTLTTDDPSGPCTFASDNMTITINPVATVNAGPDQTICIGSTVTMAGLIGGSAATGIWSGGTGGFAPANTDPNAVYTPTAAEEAAGTLTMFFTTDDPIGPCGLVADTMVITINALPTSNAGPSQSVCDGSTITLAGIVGGAATSGTWNGGTGSYAPNNTTLNAVYTPSAAEYAAGFVQLLLTTNDPAGPCTFDTASVIHYFYQNPVVLFAPDIARGCPVHCVQFGDLSTVGGGANIVSWNWIFNDAGATAGMQNPNHCFANTGLYDITLTVTSNQGCTSTATVADMIEVYAVPDAGFIPSPIAATVIDPIINFGNTSTPDVNYWEWNFGDGDSLNGANGNPVHTYPDVAGTYMVTLTVQNVNGCWDTTQNIVIVSPEFTFFIPNAFTPNGDGINDFFFGTGVGIAEFSLFIFDRWGNLIFTGDELSDQWDGKANHGLEMAQQDVYVWRVKLKDVFNKNHTYIGTVTIVK